MASILLLVLLLLPLPFNSGGVNFNKTEHNFEDVSCGGAYTCSFIITNRTNSSIKISNIITGCGCTKAEYNKAKIRSGKSSTINVTYHSGALPQSFEELIYVYFTHQREPVILKVYGESRIQHKTNAELFHERIGPFGIKSYTIDLGLTPIGTQKEFRIGFANFSGHTEKFSLASESDNIIIQPDMYQVVSNSTEYAKLILDLRDNNDKWGKTRCVLDIKYAGASIGKIAIYYTIIDNANKSDSSPRPYFYTRSISLGSIDEKHSVTFNYKNEGLEPFHIHHIEYNRNHLSVGNSPDVLPGQDGAIKVFFHPESMPKGKFIEEMKLITNSPYMPIVQLFISGEIK